MATIGGWFSETSTAPADDERIGLRNMQIYTFENSYLK